MSYIIHDTVSGLLVGLLAVFLVAYAFQPNRPYPSWILEIAETPWILILIFALIIYLFKWDYIVAIMLLLIVLAIVLDLIVFTRQITDTMEISETLFTPAINLIPSLNKGKNSNFESEILKKEDQISKKWTINKSPDPYDMRNNINVSKNDEKEDISTSISGKPLFDTSIDMMQYYPVFI